MDVRVNDRGDSQIFERTGLSGDGDDEANFTREVIHVDGFTFSRVWVRDEPEGPWGKEVMEELPGGVAMARMCQASLENIEAVLPREFVEFVGVEHYTAVDSYTDIGRGVLNGVEVRHIQHETRVEPSPDIDIDVIPYTRVDEYWLTPEGQLVKHWRMDTYANTLGVETLELIGVVSGVGEPNIIEAPLLPTPAP